MQKSKYVKLPSASLDIYMPDLERFFRSFQERQEIWFRRNIYAQPWPWTEDPVLRDYKFTNSYRELDAASQYLINNIIRDESLDFLNLVWKNIFFRFFNKPSTFESGAVEIPDYEDFNPDKVLKQVVALRDKGENPWHTAYVMNVKFLKKPKVWDNPGLFKDHAYINFVLVKIHRALERFVKTAPSVEPLELIKQLELWPAVANFQSYEFYLDFCYYDIYRDDSPFKFDQNSFVNVGPGCSLGLRIVLPSLSPKEQESGISFLRDICGEKLPDFKYIKWSKKNKDYVRCENNIALSHMEFWLCEYSKYWKILNNVGKRRSKYVPSGSVISKQ